MHRLILAALMLVCAPAMAQTPLVDSITLRSGAHIIGMPSADVVAALGFTPLNPANNLSEVNPTLARVSLGIGAVAPIGTTAGTVAAGNDSRIVGAAQAASLGNISGLNLGANLTSGAGSLSLTVGNVTGALGYAPVNPSSLGSVSGLNLGANLTSGSGNLSLSGINVTTALGYTPINPANNLSDLASIPAARINLGVIPVGTTAGTVAAGNDSRIVGAAQTSTLGNVAGMNIGTTVGTVAAGNDGRIVGAAQTATLGGASLLNVGTTAGTVAAGNDTRIVGAVQYPSVKHLIGTTAQANIDIQTTAIGSGVNGPSTAQRGLNVNISKDNWFYKPGVTPVPAVGELDGIYVTGRQSGALSDMSGILVDVQNTGTGFLSATEFVVTVVDPVANVLTKGMDIQHGVINLDGAGYGHVMSATTGTIGDAMLVQNSGTGRWGNVLRNLLNGTQTLLITDAGNITTTGFVTGGALTGTSLTTTGSVTGGAFAGTSFYSAGATINGDASNGSVDIGSLGNSAATPFLSWNGLGTAANCIERNSALRVLEIFCGATNSGLSITTAAVKINNHIQSYNPLAAPFVVSACGSPTSFLGSDTAGTVVMSGSGSTSCTITFANTFISAPVCVANATVGTLSPVAVAATTVSTTAVTFTAASAMVSGKLVFHCIG